MKVEIHFRSNAGSVKIENFYWLHEIVNGEKTEYRKDRVVDFFINPNANYIFRSERDVVSFAGADVLYVAFDNEFTND